LLLLPNVETPFRPGSPSSSRMPTPLQRPDDPAERIAEFGGMHLVGPHARR
jgi:hypothetical protein